MTAVRPAVPADIPAIAAILAANDEPVDWPDVAGWPYVDHLLARARVAVAESDGAVAGFAGAIDVGDARFLTDLFVDPARQEHGIGRALLDAAMDGAAARMTNSSADPRALGALRPRGDAAVVGLPLSRRARWPRLGRPPEGHRLVARVARGDWPRLVADVDRRRSDGGPRRLLRDAVPDADPASCVTRRRCGWQRSGRSRRARRDSRRPVARPLLDRRPMSITQSGLDLGVVARGGIPAGEL